jgi:hypothetical protein
MDGNSLHDLARLVYVLSGKLEIDLQAVHSRPHHIYLCCTLPFLNLSVDIYSYPVYTLLISCLLFCTSCISLPYTSYSATYVLSGSRDTGGTCASRQPQAVGQTTVAVTLQLPGVGDPEQ